jgi:hypothetical protein
MRIRIAKGKYAGAVDVQIRNPKSQSKWVMKDYKNVKVPRSYRTRNPRTTFKRVQVGRGPRREPSDLVAALIRILVVVLVTGSCYLGWLGYQWAVHSETFQVAGIDVTGARHLSRTNCRTLPAFSPARHLE